MDEEEGGLGERTALSPSGSLVYLRGFHVVVVAVDKDEGVFSVDEDVGVEEMRVKLPDEEVGQVPAVSLVSLVKVDFSENSLPRG